MTGKQLSHQIDPKDIAAKFERLIDIHRDIV